MLLLKIAPAYSNSVIHVKDASKAAGVLSSLLQEDNSAYAASIREKYRQMLTEHNSRKSEKKLLSLEESRSNRLATEWRQEEISEPARKGISVFEEFDLNVLSEYIDWTFFFFAWKVSGKFPAIFDDPVKGEEARKLYDDAQLYLKEIIDKKLLKANGVLGLFPAVSSGDDVLVYLMTQTAGPLRRRSASSVTRSRRKRVSRTCALQIILHRSHQVSPTGSEHLLLLQLLMMKPCSATKMMIMRL